MGGDRSLDEFATDDTERAASAETDAGVDAECDEGSEPDSTDATADSPEGDAPEREAGVDPAESTYAWSPSGATCASCEATVERRWRDEGDLVCADCKSW
ncbi:DUF7573 domain-containing protein [Salinirubrum litoreum]|uniref:DUF7573 domain-containing protein n=1 Tax=Salinirubrum litoreum TaxID=1126234 RepID=A0ABD5R6X7_9EURY|nr:hypothetical protein [Salinirubrum litoreum]